MNPTLDDLFARALLRIRRGASMAIRGTAIAGAIAASTPNLGGCTDAATAPDELDQDSPGGKSDWADDEGERRPDLIAFTGDAWSECRESSSRTGCYGYEVFLKVMVSPVADTEPTAKKVGVVHRSIDNPSGDRTSNGRFFATASDGREEWHVPVRVYTYEDLIKFKVWYQPGNGKTFFDDNNGEGHVYANNNAAQVIQTATWESNITVTETSVRGTVRVRVADLDFDKILGMHASIDNWATTMKFGTGMAGDKNKFYWVEDVWGNFEYWQLDFEIDGTAIEELRFASFYEHGVVNSARRYTFWDNNWGSDYRVSRGNPGGGTRG
ncbi:MAG: hypothetical protein H0V17_17450 [Deltaproteobacteria bacterium]|nr:hypothetical protein [Deltaproteobacteria bacterium]